MFSIENQFDLSVDSEFVTYWGKITFSISANPVILLSNQNKSIMTAKFSSGTQILEISQHGDKVEFFVYESGEEQVGQSIELPSREVNDLIKYLQSLQPVEQ